MVAVALPRSVRPVPLVTLFIILVLAASSAVRSAALTIVRLPFTILSSAVQMVLTLPRLPSLSKEHAVLQAALARRQVENAELREALRHLEHGRELLETLSDVHGTVAPVIGRSLLPTQQTVLLGRGRRSSLVLDTIVLEVDGVVGRVIEVQPHTALVLLLTDADSRVAGLVARSRETGLLVGRGQAELELAYVDPDADIIEGDAVVTAGLGGPFPKGLPLGTVVRVTKDAASGISRVRVRPAARLGVLEEVVCVPPVLQERQTP